METSISSWTMKELHLDLVFGGASFFLYIVVPTALLANEVRLAKKSDDSSGTASILDAMTKSAFFIVAWLLFVTLFMYLLVGLGGTDVSSNPVKGIWDFWDVDWLHKNVIASLDNGSTIYTQNGEPGLAQARGIVFALSLMKMAELLLLAVLLMLTIKLSTWLPLQRMRRGASMSDLDISAAVGFLMLFVTGMILFNFMIGINNILLKSIFDFASRSPVHFTVDSTKFNILDDLWRLIANAHDSFVAKGFVWN